ncbi:response regulator receiver protein [Denitrovibrio acetiphilus DSM 12809]|uniref:Response regulator receiver protein n=1 Tax=Denitrovibrio acetiphilus (strain DSM 12809 / NBRC 114555 / N2460) TaxID=522772 RepID=D4H4H0_DENA2|nr:response regulator [Denitrovibrio acetiphilus]ADD69299.1 response regulator receiver protein [Denitrovibrio acetiphilus DSM 12809]
MINKKILIVEDDEIARGILRLLLQKYYSEVRTAKDGGEGLDMIKDFKPDLVVTDLAMPVVDGFAVVDRMSKEYSEIPVLIVTAYREEAEKCVGYSIIHKPVCRDALLNMVCEILSP